MDVDVASEKVRARSIFIGSASAVNQEGAKMGGHRVKGFRKKMSEIRVLAKKTQIAYLFTISKLFFQYIFQEILKR